jgi:aspartyl-tRNA(Asn)/glutamyl-tRNA(Gln) amidotransferase subunit A
MDRHVSTAYERALGLLSSKGIDIEDVKLPVLEQLPDLFDQGGIVAAEAFAWHQTLLQQQEQAYDPRVRIRIARGGTQSAAHYLNLLKLRAELVAAWREEIDAADAVIMPTVPIVAPKLSELEQDDDAYTKANLLMLRNTTVINALDGCAISLPCHEAGTAPVGVMLAAVGGADRRLLAIAAHVEGLLRAR